MARITRKPSPGPKNLRVERADDVTHNGNVYGVVEATWGNPADALTDTNHKAEVIDEKWTFNASNGMSGAVVEQRGGGHVTGDHVWVRDKGIHESGEVWYDRAKYHPRRAGRYLTSVLVDVFMINGRGQTHATCTLSLSKPVKPTIGEWELDAETGGISTTIETDAGAGRAERWDTWWCVTRQDSADRNNEYATEQVVRGWTSSRDTSFEVSLSETAAQSLLPGQWIRYTAKACSRGLAGNSDVVTRSYVFAQPAVASITSVVASSQEASGVVTVRVRTNATSTAPVDSVRLQRLADTAISSSAAAAAATGWADVDGATDDGSCSGLCDSVAAARPSTRKHTWYRVATTRGGSTRFSAPVEAACLYHAADAQSDDDVTFLSLSPAGSDAVRMRLGWDNDDSTTTQVSWSANEDAWESTEQPTTFDIAWEEDAPAEGYAHSAWLTIRGLAEGVPVHVRARRYVDEEGLTSYGAWCAPPSSMSPVTPSSTPVGPVLSAPTLVARGSGIGVSWSIASGSQSAWQVMGEVDGTWRELASAGDAAMSATVPPEAYGESSSVSLKVLVSDGGEWQESEAVSVTVADAPSATVGVELDQGLVTAQPIVVVAATNVAGATAAVTVTSRGVTTHGPGGVDTQAQGEVVWAEAVSGGWTSDGDALSLSVTAPAGLDLRDGATYDVALVVKDPVTGLSSEVASTWFTVGWAHQALCPGDATVVAPDAESLSCAVTPAAPEGAAPGDVCDVWRVTPDRAYLVASDVAFGSTVVDRYAPYGDGDHAYRLCTRTADGDTDWRDFAYELSGGALRLDFGESSVDLPYDLVLQDSWQKGYEGVLHQGRDLEDGYWDGSASRSATLATDVVEVAGDEARLLRELARCAGPVMVRTPDGLAFDANVDVRDMGRAGSDDALAVSLDVREIRLTEGHMAVPEGYGEVDQET